MTKPSPASTATTAFPRGTYATYKRATSFFLTWLLRAGRNGLGGGVASSDPKQPLDAYEHIVHAIVAAPTSLSPTVLRVYPHALDACASAVTLRSRVALFFGEAADDAHAHFLARMATWLNSLRLAYATTGASQPQPPSRPEMPSKPPLDCSNYYDVLALPDGYFDDDDLEHTEDENRNDRNTTPSRAVPKLRKADRARVQHDAFADEFHTELAFFLMELDELSEAVYSAFHDVKLETKTLLEAAVVSKVAIDGAASAIAHFQLRHLSMIPDAPALVELVRNRLSFEQIQRLVATVRSAWTPRDDAPYQYVPGTVVVDLAGITPVLVGFAERFAAGNKGRFDAWDPAFELKYDEETAKRYVVPKWNTMPEFLLCCLPRLFNALIDLQDENTCFAPGSLEAWLLGPFDHFRKTSSVSIHLVFICICWVRSVAALQGNRDLARTIGGSLLHVWDLDDRFATSWAKLGRGGLVDQLKQEDRHAMSVASVLQPLIRASPLLAGCVLLDRQIAFATRGNQALLMTGFRPLSHIYSALVNRGVLAPIPFLDNVIRAHEAFVFTPSRVAATHGTFARSFLSALTLMETTVVLQCRAKQGQTPSVIDKARIVHSSRIVRVIVYNDFSGFPSQSMASWRALLSAVSDACRDELFGSRVLSRDTLRFSDDIIDLCNSLCDELGRRPHYDHLVAHAAIPDRGWRLRSCFRCCRCSTRWKTTMA